MQFEQITIDSQRFDVPQAVSYRQLDNDGKIYCKLDYLTVVFQDCCMNDVLRWIKLDNAVTDFCLGCYEQSRGYDQVFKFVYNGVLIETSSFNFYGFDIDCSIFDKVVPKIRLDLSGSALDYLRSINVDMDTYRFVVPQLPDGASYHFTRCDFAYDFINYCPQFMDQLLDYVFQNTLPSGRVPLAGSRGSAIGVRVITGNQKTVYLGSPQADKMLRCYDKRMESSDLQSGCYRKANPYGDPESWFRIEWQTRNQFAHNLVLDQTQSFKTILKQIFDRYAFAAADHDINHDGPRPVVDFWLSLMPWQEIELRIIQNAKYVECEALVDRIVKRFKSAEVRNFLFVYTLLGREGFEKLCNEYLRELFWFDDPITLRRRLAFINRLNQLPELELPIDKKLPSGGLWNQKNRYYFSL